MALEQTQEFVDIELSTTVIYWVFPTRLGQPVKGPLNFGEAVNDLCRDDAVPEWVDLSICAADETTTHVELLYADRRTANEGELMHQSTGRAPFHVLSPTLPAGWKGVDVDGKFSLPVNPRGA